MRLRTYVWFYVFSQVGCSQFDDRSNAQDYLSNIYPQNGDVIMVIIPTSGCIGCIKPAIEFLKQNIQDSLYQFVLTEVNDTKLTRNWLGDALYSNPRLIIDRGNVWRRYSLAGSYPLIIIRRNGKVSSVRKVLPEDKSVWSFLSEP